MTALILAMLIATVISMRKIRQTKTRLGETRHDQERNA